MGRRRGQEKGHLRREGPSWLAEWRDYVRLPDGSIGAVKRSRVIAKAGGPARVSIREARRIFRDEILLKLDAQAIRPGSMVTVREFVAQRFEPDVVFANKSDHYTSWLNRWVLPALGEKRLRDVRPEDVQGLIAAVAAKLSAQSAKHVRNTVRAVFRYAKQMGYFSGDLPTEFVRVPVIHAVERRVLRWDQVGPLADRLPDHRALIYLLALTGLRIGEACGLRWRRVNLTPDETLFDGERIEGFSLTVRESWKCYRGGWRRQTVKSPKSRREIPLARLLVEELAALKASSRWTGPDDPVFAGRTGRPLDYGNFGTRKLKPVAKALGLSWLTLHCLRHTADTFAEQAGLSLAERQAMMGHSNETMTLHYTHADSERVRAGMERVAARLLGVGVGVVQ